MARYPDCIINLPRITDPRGNLSFIQKNDALPLDIRRCYWIYDVPGGKERFGRALRATTELIVALSGSFDVVLEYGDGVQHTVHLCRSYKGLVIDPMTWREIRNFSTNSVALVLATTLYDETDYIRDYDEFRREITR